MRTNRTVNFFAKCLILIDTFRFTFSECERLTGDSLNEVVTWQGRSDISGIGGTIAIRVNLST